MFEVSDTVFLVAGSNSVAMEKPICMSMICPAKDRMNVQIFAKSPSTTPAITFSATRNKYPREPL